MALIEWKDEYSVCVNRFDREHKKLFSLLNDLNDAMSQGRGRFVVQGVLHELLDYTRQHFAAEEDAMRSVAFPGLQLHIAEHRELTAKVAKFAAEYSKGDTIITIDLLYFLRDWLDKHILGTDHRYKEALMKVNLA
jgi:hemerythrin-like metal-binding protein